MRGASITPNSIPEQVTRLMPAACRVEVLRMGNAGCRFRSIAGEAFTYKEARHGVLGMDYCRTNRGVACRAGDERGWLRRVSRHHSWFTRWSSWRLAFWSAGTWGWRWHGRVHHCRLHRRCDFGRDYSADKKGVVRCGI